jgi:hypothetical protein
MIKTFRGSLSDGGEERIRLSTKKGKIGYRIVKFQVMANNPITTSGEHICKIFKLSQATVTTAVDFADGNLLAVALFIHNDNYTNTQTHVIFEQEVFNQDIFITHGSDAGSEPLSYYLEIEMMTLSDNAAAVSTLRDIRLNPAPA